MPLPELWIADCLCKQQGIHFTLNSVQIPHTRQIEVGALMEDGGAEVCRGSQNRVKVHMLWEGQVLGTRPQLQTRSGLI